MVQIQTRLTSQTESTGRIKKSTGKCGRGHNISGWAARQLWLCTKGRYTELLPQPRREVRGWASPFSPSTNTIQKWIILQGNEHKKGLRRTWLPLRIVEEKVYCSYEGEHRQRWKHLGEHRVKMSPGHVRTAVKGEGRPENERSGGHKRTTGSYRKEPQGKGGPASGLESSRGGICQQYLTTGRDWGMLRTLGAQSTVIC